MLLLRSSTEDSEICEHEAAEVLVAKLHFRGFLTVLHKEEIVSLRGPARHHGGQGSGALPVMSAALERKGHASKCKDGTALGWLAGCTPALAGPAGLETRSLGQRSCFKDPTVSLLLGVCS